MAGCCFLVGKLMLHSVGGWWVLANFPHCDQYNRTAINAMSRGDFRILYQMVYVVFWSLCGGPPFWDTPWKINMEPTNHPFRKEHGLPNLHDYVPCYSSGVYRKKQPPNHHRNGTSSTTGNDARRYGNQRLRPHRPLGLPRRLGQSGRRGPAG